MAVNAEAIVSKLTLDTSGFDKGVNSAKALIATLVDSSKSAGDKVQAVGTALDGLGATLTKTLTAGVATAAAAATAAAVSLDDVSRKVVTIADTSLVSMDGIKQGLSDMAAETGQSAKSLGEGMYSVISATGNTEDALAYTEIAAKAAVGGFTDTQIAVDGLTTVMNAYGLQGGDAMQRVSDQMLMTQNYGKTTFGELSQSIGQVIPLAATLKVSTDDLFGSLAVLTKQGIATSSATAGLKAAYSNVLKPTADAAKAAKELGLDFSAAAIESKGWVGFLQDVAEKTGGDTEVMARLFGSVEALNTVLALTSENGMKDMEGALNAMSGAAGATEEAFETMTGGVSGQWAQIKQQFTGIAASFGEILLPTISNVLDKVSGFLQGFQQMSPAMQEMIVRIAAIAAAIGPVITVVGKLTQAAGALMGAMSGPAGWITLAIAGVAVLTKGLIDLANAERNAERDRIEKLKGEYDFSVTVNTDTSEVTGAEAEVNGAIENLRNTLLGIDVLTDEQREAIVAIINGDKQPIIDEMTKLGIDESEWLTMDGEISDARGKVTALLRALGLTQEQIDSVIGVYSETENKILDGTPNLFQEIFDTLTDGKSDTAVDPATGKSQAEDLAEKVVAWRDGLVKDANAAMEDKLKDAKEKLDAGIITQSMYNDTVAGIKSENEEIVTDINETSDAMLKYVEECAGAQTTTVKQTETDLEGLEEKANNVMRRVKGLMTEAEEEISKRNYELLMQGVMPETETVNTAVTGKMQERDVAKAEADEKAAASIEALNEAYALKEGETMTEARKIAYDNRMKEIIKTQEEEKKAADEAYGDAIIDLANVMMGEGYEEEAIAMAEKALEETDKARVAVWESVGDMTGDYTTKYEDLSDEEKASALRWASMVKQVDTEELEPYMTYGNAEKDEPQKKWTMGEMQGPMPDGSVIGAESIVPDAEAVTEAMEEAMGESAEAVAENAEKQFEPVGESIVSGEIEGAESNMSELDGLGQEMGEVPFDGAKSYIQMGSPSKLFATVGVSMVDGIMMGAESRQNALTSKFRMLARAALQAAKDELGIASPSKKFAELGRFSVEGYTSGVSKGLMESGAKSITNNNGHTTTYNISFPNATVRNDNDLRKLSKDIQRSVAMANAGRGM